MLRHIPVLLSEVLEFFSERVLHVFVDGTLGAGGHAEALLQAHPEIKLFIGIDQDPEAIEIAKKRLSFWKEKTVFILGNFGTIDQHLGNLNITSVDGILLDLGVSSMQFDQPEKGFSLKKKGPLDMRMDPQGDLTAEEIVNEWSEEEIGRIFREYGEEKRWRVAARAIVMARKGHHVSTTEELVAILRPLFSVRFQKKGVDPLTLLFQGLRICVNRELERLEEVLPKAVNLLSPEGRMGVISFHSLEDRIVKNYFRFAASDKYDTSGLGGIFLDKQPLVKILTKKPISSSEEEIEKNPRSRSAKLRVIEKLSLLHG